MCTEGLLVLCNVTRTKISIVYSYSFRTVDLTWK